MDGWPARIDALFRYPVGSRNLLSSFDSLWRTTSTTNALDTFNLSYLGLTGQVTGMNSTQGPSMQYTYGSNLVDRRLAQIKNLGRAGNVLSQFDYTTNAEAQITQIIETHGLAGSPTPTNTTTPTNTATPTPTYTPPGNGNHNGNGHQPGHPGYENGKGHHKEHTNNGKKKNGFLLLPLSPIDSVLSTNIPRQEATSATIDQ